MDVSGVSIPALIFARSTVLTVSHELLLTDSVLCCPGLRLLAEAPPAAPSAAGAGVSAANATAPQAPPARPPTLPHRVGYPPDHLARQAALEPPPSTRHPLLKALALSLILAGGIMLGPSQKGYSPWMWHRIWISP